MQSLSAWSLSSYQCTYLHVCVCVCVCVQGILRRGKGEGDVLDSKLVIIIHTSNLLHSFKASSRLEVILSFISCWFLIIAYTGVFR